MNPSHEDDEWAVFGMPVFITDQIEPGDMLALSVIYEPTAEEPNRYRISAVKVTGIDPDRAAPREVQLSSEDQDG